MRQVFSRLWKDEDGIVALEYLLVATIIGLGLITGLVAVRQALVTELVELAAAITNINQGYSYAGYSVCLAQTGAGQTVDAPGLFSGATVLPIPTTISIAPCDASFNHTSAGTTP